MTPRKSRRRSRANYGAGSKKHARGREMSPALLHVLNHPIRRQILRLLHERRAAMSPNEMSQSIGVVLPNIGFHARTLAERGVIREMRTRQVRGSVEHFYVSTVSENKLVATILSSTENDDSFLFK